MADVFETQNQAWSKDTSRFGYQMLQKMGWSEGEGLGAKGDGTIRPVMLRRKLDTSGIGAGKNAADAWKAGAERSANLDEVLSRLGAVGNVPTPASATSPSDSEGAKARVFAPGKSKKSYFARRKGGKNVKTYNADELREIFGGKVVQTEDTDAGETSAVRAEEASGDENSIDSKAVTEKATREDSETKTKAKKRRKSVNGSKNIREVKGTTKKRTEKKEVSKKRAREVSPGAKISRKDAKVTKNAAKKSLSR